MAEENLLASNSTKEIQDEMSRIEELEAELGIDPSDVVEEEPPEKVAEREFKHLDRIEEEDKKVQPLLKNAITPQSKFDVPSKGGGPLMGLGKGLVGLTEDLLNTGIDAINWGDDVLAELGIGEDEADWDHFDFAPDLPEDPAEAAGYITGKYVTAFGSITAGLKAFQALRGIKMSSKLYRTTQIGGTGLLSGVLHQEEDPLLADLADSYPAIKFAYPIYFATTTDEDDSPFVKKAKAAFESVYVDSLLLGGGKLTKHVLSRWKLAKQRKAYREAEKISEQFSKKADEFEAEKAAKGAKGAEGAEGAEGVSDAGPKINVDDVAPETFTKAEREEVERLRIFMEEPSPEVIRKINEQGLSGKEIMEAMMADADTPAARIWNQVKEGTKSIEELKDSAREIYKDRKRMQKLLSLKERKAVLPEEMLAMGMELEASSIQLQDALKAYNGALNNRDAKAAVMISLAKFQETAVAVNSGVSEYGRGLRAFQEAFEKGDMTVKTELMDELINVAGQDFDVVVKNLSDIFKNKKATEQLAAAINNKGALGSVADGIYELWINMLLSRPSTHVKNFVGNSMMVFAAPVRTATAATISRPLNLLGLAEDEAVYFGEAYAELKGAMESITESMTTGWKTFRTGQVPEGTNIKFPELRELSLQVNGRGHGARFLNFLGKAANIPGRALVSSDAAFRVMNYRMALRREATRDAIKKGLRGKAASDHIAKLMDTPSKVIKLNANKFASKQTFTANLKDLPVLGSITESGLQFAEALPFGRVTMPFIRISGQLAEATGELIPGFALLSRRNRQILKMGGPERTKMIANMALGTGILYMGASMASDGRLEAQPDGAFSAIKALSNGKEGYLNNALINEDGTHTTLNIGDPFTQILLLGGKLANLSNYAQGPNAEAYDDLVGATLGIIAERLTPEFLTDGLSEYTNMFSRLTKGEINHERFAKAMASFWSTTLGAPILQTLIKKNSDIVKRDASPEEAVDSIMGAIASSFEIAQKQWMDSIGLGEELPAQLNIFGEEVVYPAGSLANVMTPFYTMKQTKDPLRKKLEQLGIHSQHFNPTREPGEEFLRVEMPSRVAKFLGNPIRMNPKQYNKYVKLAAGHHPKFGGRTLEKSLNQVMRALESNKTYKSMSPKGQRDAMVLEFQAIINDYRNIAATIMLQEESTIMNKIKENLILEQRRKGVELSKQSLKTMDNLIERAVKEEMKEGVSE